MNSVNLTTQQMPLITVNDLARQGQGFPVRPRSIKKMESPVSRGIDGFCLTGIMLWLVDIAKKNSSLGNAFWGISLLAGAGLGILQKLRVDKAKKDPNCDLIIRNGFTGQETVIRKDPLSQKPLFATRKYENPLSMGIIGTGASLALYGIENFFRGGAKQYISNRAMVVTSIGIGALMGIMKKLQIDGAKNNKDINSDIIIRNSLTGSEKMISNWRQG